jgi:hypothetical protein
MMMENCARSAENYACALLPPHHRDREVRRTRELREKCGELRKTPRSDPRPQLPGRGRKRPRLPLALPPGHALPDGSCGPLEKGEGEEQRPATCCDIATATCAGRRQECSRPRACPGRSGASRALAATAREKSHDG